MIVGFLKNVVKARRRPKTRRVGPAYHYPFDQVLHGNFAPCGGTGGNWEHGLYPDTTTDAGESPFAQGTRLNEARERERVYGWGKLERPTVSGPY